MFVKLHEATTPDQVQSLVFNIALEVEYFFLWSFSSHGSETHLEGRFAPTYIYRSQEILLIFRGGSFLRHESLLGCANRDEQRVATR